MNYEGMYNQLIVDRNSFISDSMKTKSKMEKELRLLEAELKLYNECCNQSNLQRYADLQFNANEKCIKKLDEIAALDQKVNDAQHEIKVLEELIKLELFNENALII